MPKKIYDIKPPKVVNKIKVEQKPKETVAIKRTRAKKTVYQQAQPVNKEPIVSQIPAQKIKKQNRSFKKPIFIGASVLVIMFGIFLFFALQKVDVLIWPKVETLSFKETITADKSATSIDEANIAIPAQYFEATKTNSQDFPATGNADNAGQATGSITIYNKYDPATPFSFKAGTHFMSDSGKLFVALQKVSIPAATKSGSKITPGSVTIQVQAVEGGTDYNIAPSNFSIPGLKGTAYYYSVYATSTSAMTGGYTGKVKKVTDDDIQGAQDVLTKKTTDDATTALKSQIPTGYVLLDNASLSNVTNASTPTKSGTVADKFTYSVTVKASALVFKKSDIDQFAKNYIISKIPDGKTLLDSTFKDDYSASSVDVSGGKATINLNCSSGVYQNIDKNSVALSLIGENENQIKQTINNSLGNQISKVQINFWPFWVTSAPNSQKTVNIQLKF
jgi:hypothetical protein